MYLTQPRILWTLLRRRRKKAFGSLFGLGLRSRPKEKVLFRGSFCPILVATCIFFSHISNTAKHYTISKVYIFLEICSFYTCALLYQVYTFVANVHFCSKCTLFYQMYTIFLMCTIVPNVHFFLQFVHYSKRL